MSLDQLPLSSEADSSINWVGSRVINSLYSSPSTLAKYLCAHAFRDLFIEELGWDRVSGHWSIEVGDQAYRLEAIAHKRGFQVFCCHVDRLSAIDRGRLRAIQKRIATNAHEHIVVYASADSMRQIWQWGLRLPDGKRLRHLEHPFFSNAPPPNFLKRLEQLRFALDDEETTTLLDAISRVREVLGRKADLNLFAKRPRYARRSDELARAMIAGGEVEFREFVHFHRRLAKYLAKRWYRHLHIDLDEAEQLCTLGLMRAARRFDPDRGIQFATYASITAKRHARRLAADIRFPMRLPQYVLPTCFAAQRLQHDVIVSKGPQAAREAVEQLVADVPKPVAQAWDAFERMETRASVSDCRDPASKAAQQIAGRETTPDVPLIRDEVLSALRDAIGRLGERETLLIRLYYGLDGESLTLKAIGDRIGLTRERVRQIISECLKRLRAEIGLDLEELERLLPA